MPIAHLTPAGLIYMELLNAEQLVCNGRHAEVIETEAGWIHIDGSLVEDWATASPMMVAKTPGDHTGRGSCPEGTEAKPAPSTSTNNRCRATASDANGLALSRDTPV